MTNEERFSRIDDSRTRFLATLEKTTIDLQINKQQ
jgi:hypothetical protein